MIPVDCDNCQYRGRCRMFSVQHRVTVLAWAHGLPAPDCKDYQPRFYHGIEGVLSPLPPSAYGANQ